jgi:hypothetical protein
MTKTKRQAKLWMNIFIFLGSFNLFGFVIGDDMFQLFLGMALILFAIKEYQLYKDLSALENQIKVSENDNN